MPLMCDVCLSEISLLKSDGNSVLHDNILFCSSGCFFTYIETSPKLDTSKYPDVFNAADISYPFEAWSSYLNMFFRSQYEATVADWFFLKGIKFEYEKITIHFGDNSTYTPDFYLPDFGFFVEVKGLWLGSGKKKLKRACKLGINIELLPYYLKNSFVKDNKNEISRRGEAKIYSQIG